MENNAKKKPAGIFKDFVTAGLLLCTVALSSCASIQSKKFNVIDGHQQGPTKQHFDQTTHGSHLDKEEKSAAADEIVDPAKYVNVLNLSNGAQATYIPATPHNLKDIIKLVEPSDTGNTGILVVFDVGNYTGTAEMPIDFIDPRTGKPLSHIVEVSFFWQDGKDPQVTDITALFDAGSRQSLVNQGLSFDLNETEMRESIVTLFESEIQKAQDAKDSFHNTMLRNNAIGPMHAVMVPEGTLPTGVLPNSTNAVLGYKFNNGMSVVQISHGDRDYQDFDLITSTIKLGQTEPNVFWKAAVFQTNMKYGLEQMVGHELAGSGLYGVAYDRAEHTIALEYFALGLCVQAATAGDGGDTQRLHYANDTLIKAPNIPQSFGVDGLPLSAQIGALGEKLIRNYQHANDPLPPEYPMSGFRYVGPKFKTFKP